MGFKAEERPREIRTTRPGPVEELATEPRLGSEKKSETRQTKDPMETASLSSSEVSTWEDPSSESLDAMEANPFVQGVRAWNEYWFGHPETPDGDIHQSPFDRWMQAVNPIGSAMTGAFKLTTPGA